MRIHKEKNTDQKRMNGELGRIMLFWLSYDLFEFAIIIYSIII